MNNQKKKKQLSKYIRFTGIGFQLGATIYLAAYLGKWLDAKFDNDKKVITLLLIIISLAVSIWNITQQLKKMDN